MFQKRLRFHYCVPHQVLLPPSEKDKTAALLPKHTCVKSGDIIDPHIS